MSCKKSRLRIVGNVLSASFLICTINSATAAVFFTPLELPDLPSRFGNSAYVVPSGVSPDGNRVVGSVVTPGIIYDCFSPYGCTSSFSWEAESGITIGGVAGFPSTVTTPNGEKDVYAARMTAASNYAVLGAGSIPGVYTGPLLLTPEGPVLLTEDDDSVDYYAIDLSNDGRVVIGNAGFTSASPTTSSSSNSFRWTPDGGVESFGGDGDYLTAISGDGQVIVGNQLNFLDPPRIPDGFRWSESEGFQSMPKGPNEKAFLPLAVSENGRAIVGYGSKDIAGPSVPLLWTDSNAAVSTLLSLPAGIVSGSAVEISDDGELILGNGSMVENGPLGPFRIGPDAVINDRALVWDEQRQVHLLKNWLAEEYGLGGELAGWTLTSASAISGDGTVIAGLGINPAGNLQGWVASVPEPCSLALSAFACLAALSTHRRRFLR